MDDELEDTVRYLVVVNDEGQHSIWLEAKTIPAGWHQTGAGGTKAQCLEHIDRAWTDMTPMSLRRAKRVDRAI
jgi:MbtH protein